jgi:hypothetical protein
MVHLWLRVGLLIVASGLCFAQTSAVAPISGQNPQQLPTLVPQLRPPLLIPPEPPLLPSLPEAQYNVSGFVPQLRRRIKT